MNECYDYLRKKRVRKLVYESDFSAEDSQRMETSDPATDQAPPVDKRLAQHDLIVKLLSKISEEDRSSDPFEGSGRAFGGRTGRNDRHEREHH